MGSWGGAAKSYLSGATSGDIVDSVKFSTPGMFPAGLAERATMQNRKPIGTTARTGETCPESGVWKPNGYNTTAPIAKGNRMPPYNGQAVTWTLIQYA
jgi:hypothetical protein